MTHPLRRYDKHHAMARPRPGSPANPIGNPVSDIVVCLNQIVQLTAEIYSDLGQIISSGPTPPPIPMPNPNPTPGTINWPSYQGTATQVGVSPDGLTTVFYDASLGASALACAQQLVSAAAGINAANAKLFATPNGPTNVIVFALGGATDGSGGADHNACDFVNGQNIEVCVDFSDPGFCGTLYEAELSECSMNGQLCGLSTGEALSRWGAMVIDNNTELASFASAPVWASAGFPNWVDTTEGTDQDYNSIGCGMAFISWLIGVHGYAFDEIAQEMVRLGDTGTLATLYEALSGTSGSPWATFLAACHAATITTDDPFNGMATATV